MPPASERHHERISRLRAAFQEAHERFMRRLRAAPREVASRTPDDGGWSLAQIAWHVAAVDRAFAALLSGERRAQPLAPDFTERPWPVVVAAVPAKLEASGPVVPPPDADVEQALASLDAAARQLVAALDSLTPDRAAAFGVTHHAVGTISLYQVGDWAIAHTIRHNAQAKRVLTRLVPSPSAGA